MDLQQQMGAEFNRCTPILPILAAGHRCDTLPDCPLPGAVAIAIGGQLAGVEGAGSNDRPECLGAQVRYCTALIFTGE